jgi:hypothetical protein
MNQKPPLYPPAKIFKKAENDNNKVKIKDQNFEKQLKELFDNILEQPTLQKVKEFNELIAKGLLFIASDNHTFLFSFFILFIPINCSYFFHFIY